MRKKENYAMRKLAVPKEVKLPGKTFFARYERIKKGDLPRNKQMKRICRQRGRCTPRQQHGRGFKDTFKKLLKHPIIKKIARKGINMTPKLYKNITKRVKNKKLAAILNSDIANTSLKHLVSKGNNLLGPQEKAKKRRQRKKQIEEL